MYRRSRTSADILTNLPHFEYIVRCAWEEERASGYDAELAAPRVVSLGDRDSWWDELPDSYVLRRQWKDIERFHDVVATKLAFDSAIGISRIKARVPALPSKGDLGKFELAVAATGDTLALNRKNRDELGTGKSSDPWRELEVLHTVYVENRLGPYFEEMNKVLAEIPIHLLQDCDELRKFVTSGASCKHRPTTPLGKVHEKFFGQIPFGFSPEELAKPAAALRKATEGSILAKHLAVCKPPARPQSSGAKGPRSRSVSGSPHAPPPPRGSIPTMPDPTSPQCMLGSFSTPALGSSAIFGDDTSPTGDSNSFERTLLHPSGEQKRSHRLATSHYGFFAHSSQNTEDFGYSSKDHFWKRMRAKENAELGRRLLLHTGRQSAQCDEDLHLERLPALPPSSPANVAAKTWGPSQGGQWTKGASGHGQGRRPQASFSFKDPRLAESRFTQTDTLLKDITDGLRCTILGEVPNLVPKGAKSERPVEDKMPASQLVWQEQTLAVYKVYCRVHRGMGSSQGDASSDEEHQTDLTGDSRRRTTNRDDKARGALTGLVPMPWAALLEWADQQEDSASDFRKKSVCGALNRALKLWLQSHAMREEHIAGVPLAQFLGWVWPGVACDQMETMLKWVCVCEIDKIRQPTPRVIEDDQRRRLENLFHAMDYGSKGHCTAEDISGGRDQGIEAKLKNIVDHDTVRAFRGEHPINITDFMELMCEDGFRAHKGAIQVVLEKGGRLTRHSRDVVGVTIWTLDDPPASELPRRQLVESIEVEIKRWRRLAVLEAAKLQHLTSFDSDG